MAPASNWSNQLLCQRQDLDGAVCLALTGELDLASVSSLQAHLKAIAQLESNLVIDLSGLRYIDSTGAKAFLDTHRLFARTGRRIVLATVQPMTLRILEVMGLQKVIPVFPTVDAALANLRGGGKADAAAE